MQEAQELQEFNIIISSLQYITKFSRAKDKEETIKRKATWESLRHHKKNLYIKIY